MSDPRDDIDPEAIPTLTEVIVPGEVKQLSLDGLPPEPEPSAQAKPRPTSKSARARQSGQDKAEPGTDEAPAQPARALDDAGLEALVDEVLQRHLAGLREELLDLLRRELAARGD